MDLSGRRYAVSASLVELATSRRLAGDWRGAGRAAGFQVEISLYHLRHEHGAEVAAQVEQDLQHLAPDLVRWHIAVPTLFDPGVTVVLARYDGGSALFLERGRVRRLTVGHPSQREVGDWSEARYRWDVRRAPDLGQADDAAADREWLRAGIITVEELHPLVRAALAPGGQAPDEFRPRPPYELPATLPIECQGEWHELGWSEQGSGIAALSHSDSDVARERVLESLGGVIAPCLSAMEHWPMPYAYHLLPPSLRDLRRHIVLTLAHGNTDELLRLRRLGVDLAGLTESRLLARVDRELLEAL